MEKYVIIFDKTNKPLLILPFYFNNNTLYAISNYYTANFQPLFANNLNIKEIYDITEYFIKSYLIKNNIHYLTLSPVNIEVKEITSFVDCLKAHHFSIKTDHLFVNWFHKLNLNNYYDNLNTYEQYFQQRPSKLQNTIKRKTKQLRKTESHHLQIHTSYDDIKAQLSNYDTIYQKSWKPDEYSYQFIHDLMLTFAQQNKTRLGIAMINNEPAAAQFWLVHNQEALIVKLAHDPKFQNLSIGTILTNAMFQYVIEIDQVHKIDFLTGNDSYKKDWMTEQQDFYSVTAYNNKTIKGLALSLKYQAKTNIKKWMSYHFSN
ncbi:MAG: GNAT family N-acetyltransferase [Gammaproteobacteria bacterium]|nr:GNAT family N-acetyltransferase [Gammaproteobacteria bacterium]